MTLSRALALDDADSFASIFVNGHVPRFVIHLIIDNNCVNIARWLDDRGCFEAAVKQGDYALEIFRTCCANKSQITPLIFDHAESSVLYKLFDKLLLDDGLNSFGIRYLANHVDINAQFLDGTWFSFALFHYLVAEDQESILALIDFGVDITLREFAGHDSEHNETFRAIELKMVESSAFVHKYAHERRDVLIKTLIVHGLIPDLAAFVGSFTFKR